VFDARSSVSYRTRINVMCMRTDDQMRMGMETDPMETKRRSPRLRDRVGARSAKHGA